MNALNCRREDGKQLCPFEFDGYRAEAHHKLVVKKGAKWGVVDAYSKKVLLPFEYDIINSIAFPPVYSIRNDMAPAKEEYCFFHVKKGDRWLVVDANNKELPGFGNFSTYRALNRSRISFGVGEKWGVKDLSGNTVIEPTSSRFTGYGYDFIGTYSGHQSFLLHGKDTLRGRPLSSKHKIDAPLLAVRETGGKVGLINPQLGWVADPVYDDIGIYSEGYFAVRQGDQVGFVDQKGEIAIPLSYHWDHSSQLYHRFQKGKVIVYKNKKYGIIDTKNGVVVPFEYDNIFWFDEYGYMGRKDGNWIELD